jgi:hypothetical protein
MKKTLVLIASLAFGYSANAQTILGDCTDLSGDCLYYVQDNVIVTNADKKKGFTFSPSVDMRNGQLVCTGIIAQMVNIGSCCEKNSLILLLDDGSKIMLKSWNKFNCEGDAYFSLTKDEVQLLREHKMVKGQLQNGYSFESFQNDIPVKNQDYFIRFLQDVDANKYTPVKD